MWEGYALPIADSPEEHLSKPHEGIAQFYTFKLLDWLSDRRLTEAFLSLERNANPVYRAWRQTEQYSLESMREVLVRLRSNASDWPPQ